VHRYDEPACKWKQDELDHSVMLVGYGSTEDGKDYWTVK
jgi:Papain family cysteine protease